MNTTLLAGLCSAMRLACLSLAMLLVSCASTKHLYVAPQGADSNPGTREAPFRTIARADSAAAPGYTIHVAPGTYQVSAPGAHKAGIATSRNGTAAARLKFVSDVKWGAKIIVSGTGIAWRSKGSYVDIEGFDISGSGRHGIVADGARLTITNNFIHDLTVSGGCSGSGGAAIDTNGGPGHVLIKGNVVRNIGVAMIGKCNTVQGIYIANPNNTVVNNIVSGVAAAGIQQWHGATDSTIMNNTVFRCKVGILIGGGDADVLPDGSKNNYVANNIVYDNITYGIVEGGKVGGNNRYVDNLVHSSGAGISVQGRVNGTIVADPEFIDYRADGSGDYRLRKTSPGIRRHAKVSERPISASDTSHGMRPNSARITWRHRSLNAGHAVTVDARRRHPPAGSIGRVDRAPKETAPRRRGDD